MRKTALFIFVIILVFSFPVFAGVSLDLGASALGNATVGVARPLGAEVSIGLTLFNYKALIQITGGFLSPPLAQDFNDAVGIISAGVLYSPIKFLYIGFRTGMISPIEDSDDWPSYGGIVIRVQTPGRGIHFYGESEIGLLGIFNRFSAGINLTF